MRSAVGRLVGSVAQQLQQKAANSEDNDTVCAVWFVQGVAGTQ
jgi:hypothetical protein